MLNRHRYSTLIDTFWRTPALAPDINLRQRISLLADYLEKTEFSDDIPLGHGARSDRFQLPGETEYRTREDYLENGVPLPPGVVESLREFDADLNTQLSL